jgi:hypothetical protein
MWWVDAVAGWIRPERRDLWEASERGQATVVGVVSNLMEDVERAVLAYRRHRRREVEGEERGSTTFFDYKRPSVIVTHPALVVTHHRVHRVLGAEAACQACAASEFTAIILDRAEVASPAWEFFAVVIYKASLPFMVKDLQVFIPKGGWRRVWEGADELAKKLVKLAQHGGKERIPSEIEAWFNRN